VVVAPGHHHHPAHHPQRVPVGKRILINLNLRHNLNSNTPGTMQ
jgi:hypothetical protein